MQMNTIKITQGKLLNERQLLSLITAGWEGSWGWSRGGTSAGCAGSAADSFVRPN